MRRANRIFPRFRGGRESRNYRLATDMISASRWAKHGTKLDFAKENPEFKSHFKDQNRHIAKPHAPHPT